MEPFIAEIIMFGGNFSPRGWAFCQGQLLPISSNSALFSLLGTTYGGDGRTTFGLPDLRGRVPIQQGQGPGLPSYRLGETGGSTTHTLSTTEMPSHTHGLEGEKGVASTNSPANAMLAAHDTSNAYSPFISTNDEVAMASQSITNTGGGGSHNNMQPYLALNFIIALVGTYPSRN